MTDDTKKEPTMGVTLTVTQIIMPGSYPIGFMGAAILNCTTMLTPGTYSLEWTAAVPVSPKQ